MSKSKKILLVSLCILVLTIFLPVLIDYQQVGDLGIENIQLETLVFPGL